VVYGRKKTKPNKANFLQRTCDWNSFMFYIALFDHRILINERKTAMAWQLNRKMWFLALLLLLVFACLQVRAAEIAKAPQYSVAELTFDGPVQGPKDVPARDIDFWAQFRHVSGSPEYKIHGFWDGDGKGGTTGGVFKIRFCPTKPGRWDLVDVYSNKPKLNGQKQSQYVTATASDHPGFWIVDTDSPGRRWYMRSDGSHQYIFGNTHYTFLSGYKSGGKLSGNDIAADIIGNAKYFKKLRFSLYGGRYVNPDEKPFFDDDGHLSDSGDNSHRPNPRWFHNRVPSRSVSRRRLRHDRRETWQQAGPVFLGMLRSCRAHSRR
jgi:hypothetical protein